MTIKIGKGNYSQNASSGSQFEKTAYYKLGHKEPKDRVLVVRIAPPVKDLAERGDGWKRYLKTHFGYTVPFQAKDGAQKQIPVTFQCVERLDRDGTVKVACPECKEVKARRDTLAADIERLKKAGKSDEEVALSVDAKNKWLRAHNLDKKWNLLAKNRDGKWGILTISHKAQKRLTELFKTLAEKGIDALDPERGVWLRFRREGVKFNEIEDYVEVETEEAADGSIRRKHDSLTEADLQALEKLPSLSELGRNFSVEEIASIVDSAGEPDLLRSLTGIGVRRAAQGEESPGADEAEESADSAPAPRAEAAPKAAPPLSAAIPAVGVGKSPESIINDFFSSFNK